MINLLQMLAAGRWTLDAGCLAASQRVCTPNISLHRVANIPSLLRLESERRTCVRWRALEHSLQSATTTMGSAEGNITVVTPSAMLHGLTRERVLAVIRASACHYVELSGKHVSVLVPTP